MRESSTMHVPSMVAECDSFPALIAAEPSQVIADTVWHSLLWLVMANAIGVLIATLLLVPGLNGMLNEWTYGRWVMVHMNLDVYKRQGGNNGGRSNRKLPSRQPRDRALARQRWEARDSSFPLPTRVEPAPGIEGRSRQGLRG